MQMVFMNTLEKRTEEGRVVAGQVAIGETQGNWTVCWTEPDGSGERRNVWFEGTSWEEMIAAFRHGIAVVMGEGYEPVLDGMLEEKRMAGGTVSMLQCYGELHAREELFEALREWRRGKAVAEKKAAYLVSTNRLLWMISAFVPHTEEELKQIPGWGSNKSAAYAADIIAVTTRFDRLTTFPLTWVPEELGAEAHMKWLLKQKENKYRAELERHRAKRDILNGVREGCGLDELVAMLGIERRDLIERIELLDHEGYDMSPLLDRELQQLPEEERQKIGRALQEVGDRYLKPVLKQVYSESELQGKPLDPFYERLRLMRLRQKRIAALAAM